MILKIYLECRYILSMSEFVCLNTFCTFDPTLRNLNRGGGGGGKVYILLERSLHWKSKNFTSKAIGATRKKFMWKKSEMDVTHQPQLRMLLLLHLWKELLQI